MSVSIYDDQRISALLDGQLFGPERDDVLARLASDDDAYIVAVNTVAALLELEEVNYTAPRALSARHQSTFRSMLGKLGFRGGRARARRGEARNQVVHGGQATDWTDLRGDDARYQIAEAAGGLLSSATIAERLRFDASGVATLAEGKQLLMVPLPDGQSGFPAKQFLGDGRVRAGVAEVADAGARVDPWVLLSILIDDAENKSGSILLERLHEPAVLEDVLNRIATYGRHVAG